MNEKLTFAFCTYNRSRNLPELIRSIRGQISPIPFEILVVDNNSSDDTQQVLSRLANEDGAPLRICLEKNRGIVAARNRVLAEAQGSTYLIFVDDDEIPREGLIKAAVDAFRKQEADCVGGKVKVYLEKEKRPRWLTDELLGFLAEIDYGEKSFVIEDEDKPVWTANVAYKMSLFDQGLQFNYNYNRIGYSVGGGEDVIMFKSLLSGGARIIYRPDMVVDHMVEESRLKRRYFIKLHFVSGKSKGLFEAGNYSRTIFGIPLFLFPQALKHLSRTISLCLKNDPHAIRQAMTFAHSIGVITGCYLKSKTGCQESACPV